jgi:UDP-N-acetyl-2-amino-2-deoxyglucuronate dehydrogenase
MKKFALIGAAGYIAPRHLEAIKKTGNQLVAAMDINDSVGVMDSYFPDAEFFTVFEEFAAFVEDEALKGNKLDFISICSPNYLHSSHMKFALKNGIDVICEKPLVLCSEELDSLKDYEQTYKAQVNSILQLRLHPSIIALKEKVAEAPLDKIFNVELTYMTSRGKWYMKSWKGFEHMSGGVATNVGVHFYDMLHYVFGKLKYSEVHYRDTKTASGYLEYERANVKWFLSIDENNLPHNAVKGEKRTFRSVSIGNEEIEFSSGFTDLHTESYQKVLCNEGFGIDENSYAIQTVELIRKQEVINAGNRAHPLLNRKP